jgi:hypothetical protein
MDYHKERFEDHSLMLSRKNELFAIFPAAISPLNTREIVSHPGLTFGGLIMNAKESQDFTEDCLNALTEYYSNQGYERLIYKAVPSIYQRRPTSQDEYFLWKAGFQCFRIDLSVSINLSCDIDSGSRRLRGLKKAEKSLNLSNDIYYLESFWKILTHNLESRHSATPTHTLDEIKSLILKFPTQITPIFAIKDGRCVAGVVVYKTSSVHHAQYISADYEGQEVGALDLIFDSLIFNAKSKMVNFFDFGISSLKGGTALNEGLYSFKYEFGGGGVCHRFYTKEI